MNDNRNEDLFAAGSNNEVNRDQQTAGTSSSERSGTSRRGFASMDRERQREIARKGGKAAHQQGVAHQWSSEEAREAGRKGGQSSRGSRNNSGPGNNQPIM